MRRVLAGAAGLLLVASSGSAGPASVEEVAEVVRDRIGASIALGEAGAAAGPDEPQVSALLGTELTADGAVQVARRSVGKLRPHGPVALPGLGEDGRGTHAAEHHDDAELRVEGEARERAA